MFLFIYLVGVIITATVISIGLSKGYNDGEDITLEDVVKSTLISALSFIGILMLSYHYITEYGEETVIFKSKKK